MIAESGNLKTGSRREGQLARLLANSPCRPLPAAWPASPRLPRSGRSLEAWVVEAAPYARPTLRTCPWSVTPPTRCTARRGVRLGPGPASAGRRHAAAKGLPLGAAPPLYQKPSDTPATLMNHSFPTHQASVSFAGMDAGASAGKNFVERAKRRSSWRRSPTGRRAKTVANPAS